MNFIERNADMILGAVFASPVYLALTAAWVRRLTRNLRIMEEANAELRCELGELQKFAASVLQEAFLAKPVLGAPEDSTDARQCVPTGTVRAGSETGAPADALPDVQEPLDAERDPLP